MSKTIVEAIIDLASKVKGSEVKPRGNRINEALDALVDAMTGEDVPVSRNCTIADAIDVITANYTPGGGGGDFSTATVTYTADDPYDCECVCIQDDALSRIFESGEGGTVTAVLYKGSATIVVQGADIIVVSGSAESSGDTATITGDCTLSFVGTIE